MVHKSKVDWWMKILLIVLPIVAIIPAVMVSIKAGFTEAWTSWAGVLFLVLLYWIFVIPVEYHINQDVLIVRFGLIRSKIKYEDIKGVKPSRNPISSPALSLDRLGIDLGSKLPNLISPQDKSVFLQELSQHTPHLKIEGDSLVSKG